MLMQTRDDQDLWDSAVQGDSDAFGELFRRHRTVVYNYCFRRTASWSLAEDLTAQTFLETWRQRTARDLAGGSLVPWLIGVASRVASNELRARRRRDGREVRAFQPSIQSDVAETVASKVDDERAMAEVLNALKNVRKADRDVIEACVFAELDYAAAADLLGIPVGTVRSRLARARRRLQQLTPPSADSTK